MDAEELAAYLGTAVAGIDYDATQVYADGVVGVYVEQLPADPDVAVAVLSDGGSDSDSLIGWDEPRFQIRVRGDRDIRTSRAIAKRIYSALHGLMNSQMPDGTWVGLVTCSNSGPVASAPDDEGRWQWVVGADLKLANVTEHRA